MTTDFSAGQFYGASAFARGLPGLDLAHFAATTPEHEVAEHSHDGAHFVLATQGRYITTASGSHRQGPVLVYNPPGVVHRDRFAGEGGWFFAVSLERDLWRAICEHSDLPGDALRLSRPQAVGSALRLLRLAANPDSSCLDLEARTLELVAQVAPEPDGSACPPWLRRAHDFIADMAAQNIGMEDVARAAGVHRVYLARQYRRWLGRSPGDDLRSRRLERAAQAILTTPDRLSEIALSCGFCDQSHMNRAFSTHWGISPATLMRFKVSNIQDRRGRRA